MARGIQCFASPTREKAIAHSKDYYGWLLNGEALYRAIETTHPLCTRVPVNKAQPCCFETFPYAICCALAGRVMMGRNKRAVRRELLVQAGVDSREFTNIDWIACPRQWLDFFVPPRGLSGKTTQGDVEDAENSRALSCLFEQLVTSVLLLSGDCSFFSIFISVSIIGPHCLVNPCQTGRWSTFADSWPIQEKQPRFATYFYR